MGKVPNTIRITRHANHCHPTATAVKMSFLFYRLCFMLRIKIVVAWMG